LSATLPKGLKAEEALKAFEMAGGQRRSGKGSHVNLKMPNGRLVTIPREGELKAGLLRAAIRKAGFSVEEFVKMIGRR
jgi:predicted RNA binding protein YcfA (HicA-like mRNA interferase family)